MIAQADFVVSEDCRSLPPESGQKLRQLNRRGAATLWLRTPGP